MNPSTFASEPPSLCVAHEPAFWARHSWRKFSEMGEKHQRVVVIPMAGTADWGLGHPLDAEETLLMAALRDACVQTDPRRMPLVVPALRFVAGFDPGCAFAVDPPTAHALIAEVTRSVAAAGFRKIVLFNASPWNEEICAAAARDLRIACNLHMFQIHLSALGLDFHPSRSRSRRQVQSVLTSLLGTRPEVAAAGEPGPRAWADEAVHPLPGPALGLEEARVEGARVLSEVASKLARLLEDIHDRPPLAVTFPPA